MDSYDVVVIGGGIHGVGVAQAAAAAGHTVLLLEKNNLAYGSSSRSSKLIHGGLRYLESAQFSLVRECLSERHLLSRIAPDLVRLETFYIPIYDSTSRSRLTVHLGLSLYALLGGVKSSTRFRSLDKHQRAALDGLKQDGLKAVYQYYDGRTDDAALTQAVMQSAIELGAEYVIPAEFVSAECKQDVVYVTYMENGIEKHCEVAALVNAAGAWVNDVLNKISPDSTVLNVELVQGTHLVLDGLPVKQCFYLEAPQDRRAVFLLQWKDKTLLGTTEINFTDKPEKVHPLQLEKDYLLEIVKYYFPENESFTITEAFSGLRVLPLGEDNFNKSRDTVLHQSHLRVINIYGGKLTTYRLVAQKVMKKLANILPTRTMKNLTENIPLKAV